MRVNPVGQFCLLIHIVYASFPPNVRDKACLPAAGILRAWSLVYWSHACAVQRLLWTKSTLLLQNLFLLCFELRINLGTLGRLVAVILCLMGTRTLANHASSRRWTLEEGTQRVTYRQCRVFL